MISKYEKFVIWNGFLFLITILSLIAKGTTTIKLFADLGWFSSIMILMNTFVVLTYPIYLTFEEMKK